LFPPPPPHHSGCACTGCACDGSAPAPSPAATKLPSPAPSPAATKLPTTNTKEMRRQLAERQLAERQLAERQLAERQLAGQSMSPTGQPTGQPTQPTPQPTGQPTGQPTQPTPQPTQAPTHAPRVYTETVDTICDSSVDDVWIVPSSSSYYPSGCSGTSLQSGKCRQSIRDTPVSECQLLCDKEATCSGFTLKGSGCWFRGYPLDQITSPSSGNICYAKQPGQANSHPLLACSRAPVLPCSRTPVLPCSRAPVLPCSRAPVLRTSVLLHS
jgi:hypothetical protein